MANVVLVSTLTLGASACQDFLDVNKNPNAPETTAPINYLPPMINWVAMSEQYDGRFVGRYSQMWMLPSPAATTRCSVRAWPPPARSSRVAPRG